MWQDRLDVWTERFNEPSPNQFVVVAYEGDELVGFACVYGARDDRSGSYLDNLHAHPDRRRQGIGKSLVREAVGWCETHYPDVGFHLAVLKQNANAQRFYESLGAVDVGGYMGEPPGGGPPIEVRRYVWAKLSEVRV